MAELYEFCTTEQAYLNTMEDDEDKGESQFSLSQLTNTTLETSELNNSTIVPDETVSDTDLIVYFFINKHIIFTFF